MTEVTGLFKKSPALFSGKYVEYITPNWLYHKLDDEFDFTLDPCTTKDNPLRTTNFYTKEDNGLTKSWWDESVYVNPPYGRDITKWVKKSFDSIYVDSSPAKVVVMLLPARVDTEWFHRYIYHTKGAEVRFIRGRLKFEGDYGHNTAPFPSMLVIFRR